MTEKTIDALGDSITNGFWDEEGLGWFGRLNIRIAKNFPYKYSFNNMSKGGDTVCDLYHRFVYEAFSRNLDVILLNIGINDLVRTPTASSPTYLSESFRIKYWNKLLDIAQKYPAKIMVMDILPVIEERGAESKKYSFNMDVKSYNKIIEDICNARGIHFFKRFDKWLEKDLNNLYADAVHPNAQAHQTLADEIYGEMIRAKLIGDNE